MKNFKNIYYLSFLLLMIPVTNCFSAILTVNSTDEMNPESLRQLVNIAEDGDTIIFNSTIDENTPIVLTEGEILIEKKISILATTSKPIVLDANFNSRIFAIISGGELTLNNIKLVNGDKTSSSENGGAIWNAGSLNLNNCIIENNSAFLGGAIYNSNQLSINKSFFKNNQAVRYGGAVYYEGFANVDYKPIINGSTFTNNTAQLDGGAFYNDGYGGDSSPIFLNCIFAWNMATDDGGVMFNNAHYGRSTPLIVNCTIFGNISGDEGSVVSSYGDLGVAITTFYNSIIWNNDAGNGESFANNNSQTVMSYCMIQENSCPEGCDCMDDLGMIYNVDPLFSTTNDFTGEFSIIESLSLSENTPAINQGNDSYILDFEVEYDILGNTRIFDGNVDMGAFEYDEIVLNNNYTFMLDLKVYLEGAFDGNTGQMRCNLANLDMFPTTSPFDNIMANTEPESINIPELDNIVDWLYLEFRTSLDGESIYSKSVLLKDDGVIVDVDGEQNFTIELPEFNSLYIVIRHKNHLDIMSQEIMWDENESLIEYDFTSSISQAYGNLQQKELGTSAVGMFSGDINWDNTIQTSDYDVWKETPAILQAYSPLDLTLDGQIQITDFDAWFVNKAKLGLPELALDNN